MPFRSINKCEQAKCGKLDNICNLKAVKTDGGVSKTRWYYDGSRNVSFLVDKYTKYMPYE